MISKSKEVKKLESEALPIYKKAENILIVDDQSCAAAAEYHAIVKGKLKAVDIEANKILNPMREALDNARSFFKRLKAPFQQAADYLNKSIGAYNLAKMKAIEEQNRKLAEESRKKEEAKKKKLMERAEKAMEKGDEEKAAFLQEEAERHFEPTPQISQPDNTIETTSGSISMRKDIKVEVKEPIHILQAILNKKIPLAVIDFKIGRLKQWAKEQKLPEGIHHGLKVERVMGTQVRAR